MPVVIGYHSFFQIPDIPRDEWTAHYPARIHVIPGVHNIPTGELRPVSGTRFDFRRPTAIGARIEQNDEQLKLGKGYDHNWVLNSGGKSLALAARVEEASTGRILEVLTTEPGIQFYTANSLNGSVKGKGGKPYNRRSGFCLETQHFPDSPNKPNFPSVVLKSGQEFQSTTVYRLTTKK